MTKRSPILRKPITRNGRLNSTMNRLSFMPVILAAMMDRPMTPPSFFYQQDKKKVFGKRSSASRGEALAHGEKGGARPRPGDDELAGDPVRPAGSGRAHRAEGVDAALPEAGLGGAQPDGNL